VLTNAEVRQAKADRLFAAVRSGALTVNVAARFALRDGAKAHALLEGRGTAGKVLLVP
jgi:NADPH2:quinone reductase